VTRTEPDPAVCEAETDRTPWALEKLPPLPAVAIRLLQLLAQDDVDIGRVGLSIAAEPVFAADVLQNANSALYGLREHVRTVAQAVVVLGTERLKGICLTRAFRMFVMPVMGTAALQRCWRNSLAGAVVAERLAYACGLNPDVAYTAGLLRDIGRLALLVKYPGPYTNMLAVSQEQGYDPVTSERDLFDIDHCQAGAWLLARMPFPAELRDVVSRHHQTSSSQPFGLVNLVRAADRMADALGFGVLALPPWADFEETLQELPAAARARFDCDSSELEKDVESRIQAVCGI